MNLQELSISKNNIATIPPEIGQLVNLRKLWLYENQIVSIPSEIGQLVNLHSLFLHINQINSSIYMNYIFMGIRSYQYHQNLVDTLICNIVIEVPFSENLKKLIINIITTTSLD